MSDTRIVVVVPTIRPDNHASFVKAWTPLFEKHGVTLVTVWDGDEPKVQVGGATWRPDQLFSPSSSVPVPCSWGNIRDLFCRRTDACRNLGFVAACLLHPTHVLTLDDDVVPLGTGTFQGLGAVERERAFFDRVDPIQSHLDALDRRVPLGWMNTAHDTDLYLRGVPYGIRDEAPVMLSHGVWVGTPDFDGETQLRLEVGNRTLNTSAGPKVLTAVPHSLPYYVGPVPRGVLWSCCGMNVMVRAEALPYLYFAPMGVDSGVPNLHRFADIFMGAFLKRKFDELGWACVTGYSTIHHTRASDAAKNFEQEKLGREWMERMSTWSWISHKTWESAPENPAHGTDQVEWDYFRSYAAKRARYETLVKSLLEKGGR